jgi:iron complex outermembrane recepter protein
MKSSGFFSRLAALLFACGAVAAHGTACADEPSAVTGELEELIVTAQKRTESVQSIPIAISAVSAGDLAALGVTEPRGLEGIVPNMRWIASNATSNIFIRGVGDITFHLNQVGAVGLYMDEVSLNAPTLSTYGLFDLQRVEVLRGPQNTLFGRNTTGGAVQFVSQKPDLDAGVSGYGTVTGGNFGRFNVEGAVNLPLNERMAVRLSAARFAQGDYINNVFLNDKEGAYQRTQGRVQLLWRMTDDLDALFNVNAGEFRGSVARYKEIGLGTPGNPGSAQCPYNLVRAVPGNGCVDQTGFADSGDYNSVSSNRVNLNTSDVKGASARFDWRLPAFTVTSLTAFEKSDAQRAEDSTGGPDYIFDFEQGSATKQWSEELRAASKDDAAVRWIVGAYFFDETADWTTLPVRANQALTNVTVPGQPIPDTNFTGFMPFTITNQKDRAYSGYGQLEFKPADKLRLTTGLRYTSDQKSGIVKDGIATLTTPFDPTSFFTADSINALVAGGTQVPAGSALRLACPRPLPRTECYAFTPFDLTNNAFGGKVSLDYQFTDDLLGYASVSRGFKAGFVSIGALDYVARGGSTVSPEYLTTYELGIKSQAFDNTLRMNAAIFNNNWRDEQLSLVLATPGTGLNPVFTNVPRTQSYGADLEAEWVPTHDWLFKSSVGLLHSAVKDIGSALAASDGAVVGSVLLAAPKITWNGLIKKSWPVGAGRASLQGNWSYTGSQHFDLINSPDQIEPDYWLFNGTAAYEFGTKHPYELSLWGKNLTGTQYCTERASQSGVVFGNTALCYVGDTRRFVGLTLTGKF